MQQVITGIQATGAPHLGNVVGAIRPAVATGRQSRRPPIYIVADLHSMLTIHDGAVRKRNVQSVAAAWLAFGAGDAGGKLYRQSRVPRLCEMALHLATVAPYERFARAHSFTVKLVDGYEPTVFDMSHPTLMSSDLLACGATHVPVGTDSREHIDIVRDLAARFNARHGAVFTQPAGVIDCATETVPGTDGRKMSKSYGNDISVFDEEDAIRARLAAIAPTHERPADDPEIARTPLRRLLVAVCGHAAAAEVDAFLADPALTWAQARDRLATEILHRFAEPKARYRAFLDDPGAIEAKLQEGEAHVRGLVDEKLEAVRARLGFA